MCIQNVLKFLFEEIPPVGARGGEGKGNQEFSSFPSAPVSH